MTANPTEPMTEPATPAEAVRPPKPPEFVFGLDLGQASDYSALTLVEKGWIDPVTWKLDVRDAKRFPLRTAYPDVVSAVKAIVERPDARPIVDLAPKVRYATGRGVASIERV